MAAKKTLPHGDFQSLFEGEECLPFGWSTANKLMAIGKDSRLSNSDHGPNLPVSWRTLYELTKLDDDTFDAAIETGAIRTDMPRKEVSRLASRAKQNTQEQPFTFPVDKTDDEAPQYFQSQESGQIQMRCGDCMEYLTQVDAESVDVVVTSPPYNIGVDYRSYDDKQPRSAYLLWLQQWADEIHRILKPDGSLFLNLGSKPSDPWVSFQAAAAVAGAATMDDLSDTSRFQLQNVLHWIKSISIDSQKHDSEQNNVLSYGHYKPINR